MASYIWRARLSLSLPHFSDGAAKEKLQYTTKCIKRITLYYVFYSMFTHVVFQLGLFLEDLADRFCIVKSRLSRIFHTWICLMEKELSQLTPFPSRNIIAQTQFR